MIHALFNASNAPFGESFSNNLKHKYSSKMSKEGGDMKGQEGKREGVGGMSREEGGQGMDEREGKRLNWAWRREEIEDRSAWMAREKGGR